jgi:erythromycin esterase-like protein
MISPLVCRRLAVLLLLACSSTAWAQPPDLAPRFDAARRPPPPVGDPILPGLWRLHGTTPDLPQDDLEPLRRIVGKAQFVGLGESIHTSGGFYEAKDRVFRFLVERLGFRVFGMETPWIRADQVEAFVQTCDGSARDAIRNIFGVWQSAEVEAMVQWMCEWNLAHPNDRVHFYGFDIQNQGPQNGAALIDFLHRLGIGDEDPRIGGIRSCPGVETAIDPEKCQDALTEIATFFDREAKPIVLLTSKQDLGWARVHLVGLQATVERILYFGEERGFRARDRGMAYVARAIHDLRFPRALTALWAHNGHLAKDVDATEYVAVEMGTLLTKALKKNYVAIGLVAHETSIDWPVTGGGCGVVNLSTGDGSIEQVLHGLGGGAGVLADLTARPQLIEPGAAYRVGSVAMVPVEQFNALLFLEVSPKMHPLAWASCQ